VKKHTIIDLFIYEVRGSLILMKITEGNRMENFWRWRHTNSCCKSSCYHLALFAVYVI